MLDLIRDNCSPDLAHIIKLGDLGSIQRRMIQAKTSDFASTYAKYITVGQEKLDDLIKLFKENTRIKKNRALPGSVFFISR